MQLCGLVIRVSGLAALKAVSVGVELGIGFGGRADDVGIVFVGTSSSQALWPLTSRVGRQS